jgi:immune inhibitor A
VTHWTKVPFNEARYGRDFCGSITCNNTWFLVRDGLAQWVDDRVNKAGWSTEQVSEYLSTFDVEDRYDYDGDGDFREPDGYIDHLQIVHAGGDQAANDPIYGSDAIWSHRWYAELTPFGTAGPEGLLQGGGVEVGEGGTSSGVTIPENRTGIWAGDYTIQPENGGLGVFAHEYAHDLGLDDLYDTSGNTGGAENSTAFWTMMSSGSNIGRLNDPDTGDHPTSFGAFEKFQLGWLDYSVVRAGRTVQKKLRPLAQKSGRHDNGVVVLLPEKRAFNEIGEPCTGCGDQYFWSGMGNQLTHTLTRSVDGGGALTAQVRYDIEEGYDYAFLEVSSDGGATWAKVNTSESYDGIDSSGTDPEGFGITGDQEEWTGLTATVPEGTNAIRWRYTTDPFTGGTGFQVDQIALDGEVIGTAEAGAEEGWTFDGFQATNGSIDRGLFLNAYFVENRQYVGDDRSLRSAYNFGFLGDRDFWVEKYPYQPGALINYWDSSYTDNNVGDHPGRGMILPVDANPRFDHMADGTLARPRVSSYDSTFRLDPAPGFTLHSMSEPYRVKRSPAVPTFNDRRDWWFNTDEHAFTGEHEGRYQPGWYSVDVPKTGTKIKVLKVNRKGLMTVRVTAGRG